MIPKPYQHQIDANSFISNKSISALFMEQGTGKTKVAIDKSKQLYDEGLIDAVIIISYPSAVAPQWIEEQYPMHFDGIEEKYLEGYISPNWNSFLWDGCGTIKSKDNFFKIVEDKKLAIFSFNVEAYQSGSIDLYFKEILKTRKIFWIIDESTSIKNGRRKPNRGKRGGTIRTNKILDYSERVKYKIILTGTPTPNSPFDLWSQYEFLKKDFFNMDYFFFCHRYGIQVRRLNPNGKAYSVVIDLKTFNIIKNDLKKIEGTLTPTHLEDLSIKHGIKTDDVMLINRMSEYSPYKNVEELKKKISDITFFVKKEDCLDLPDKVYEVLNVEMGKDQKRLYEDLKKNLYAEYKDREITLTNKLVMALRLQMITGGLFPYSDTEMKFTEQGEEYFDTTYKTEKIKDNGKLKVLIEDLETVPEDTLIIIWARFRAEIEMIEEKLLKEGYKCKKYYGGSNEDVVNEFKRKEFRILVSSVLKGGQGLNLQVSTLQYFYSNSFKADSRLQAEDRSHRIGQTNKVTYKDLICKHTIDIPILNTLKRKENLINYFREKPIEEVLF